MKIRMKDDCETGHTVIPEVGDEPIDGEQDGLTVLSSVPTKAAGMDATHCVVLLGKGAEIEVPKRLGDRLVKIGHAEAV